MPSQAMTKHLRLRLATVRKELARTEEQYEISSRLTGGQMGDRTRLEFPHIKHVSNRLDSLRAEETRILALLDPETARSAYVPVGMR